MKTFENSSRAYKQIGLVLAEALGHRVDEFAPLAAVGAGARVVAGVGSRAAAALARGAKGLGQGVKSGAKVAGQKVKQRIKKKATDKALSFAQEKLGDKFQGGYKKIKGKFTGAGDQGTIPDDKEAEEELKVSDLDNVQNEGTIMNNAYSVYSRLGHIFLETAQLLPRSNRISGLPTRVTRRLKSGEPQRTRGEGTVTHNAAGSNPYVSSRDQKLEPNRRMRRHKKENG